MTGLATEAKETLPKLAKEVAESDWQNIPEEEQERLMKQLEEHQKPAPAGRITSEKIGKEIENTMNAVDVTVSHQLGLLNGEISLHSIR